MFLWQGGQVAQGPFIKQNVVESSFPLIMYNNCKIKDYFWFRYTSVAPSLTKVGLFEVVTIITYNNFIKKDYFWSGYTSVATSLTKIGLFEVGLSVIWKRKHFSFLQLIIWVPVKRK